MAYPSTSNFTVPSDDAAWWIIRVTNADGTTSNVVCSTGGRAFVNQVQSMVGTGVDGQWGTATATALLALLRSSSANANLISGVQAEATLRRVGPWNVSGAIWLMHQQQSIGNAPIGVTITDISLPEGAVLPTWNVAAPIGPAGNIFPACVFAAGQAPAVTPQPSYVPQTEPMQVSPMTVVDTSIPSVSPVTVPALDSYVSTGVLVILGVAVLIGGAFVWMANTQTAARATARVPARNPYRRSARGRR